MKIRDLTMRLDAGYHHASMQLGLRYAEKVVVDDIVIKREPLPDDGIKTAVATQPTGENLVWGDEFNGNELDTAKWMISNEPQRGVWWAADDAYLNGDGQLVLRFQKRD